MTRIIAIGENEKFSITLGREGYEDYQVRTWDKFQPENDKVEHFDSMTWATYRFLNTCHENNITPKKVC